MNRRKGSKNVYALTDRRAITWSPLWNWKGSLVVCSYYPGMLKSVTRIENPDGTGDVLFATEPFTRDGYFGVNKVRLVESMVFETLIVPNAAMVASNEH